MYTINLERARKPKTEEAAAFALSSAWLKRFEAALNEKQQAVADLFVQDSHWRDLIAFTGTITQFQGAEAISASLHATQVRACSSDFALSAQRTQSRQVKRAGVEVFESIFEFETKTGRGYGLLRLPVDEPARAWSLLTTLHEFKGHEEPIHSRRPSGTGYSRSFAAENWDDQRRKRAAFANREPAVVIVGGGQAGLSLAASLGLQGVDTLIVEKFPRIGDNWRTRYHSLALHNEVQRNHLPYLPFPPNWPRFLSKDMLADWFEAYAMAMELNVWTGTELASGRYDDAAGQWLLTIRRTDGSERVLKPRHLVFANGVSGIPRRISLPGMAEFRGQILHTHDYQNGNDWAGKRALVLGTGASGHDVAQDLHSRGCRVSIVQRGSTTVTSLEASQINHTLYSETFPIEDSDLIAAANTYPLLVRTYQLNVQQMLKLDKDLLEGLAARGFKHDMGEDATGHQMKLRRRGGGYYLNVGASDLIIDGEIGLLQSDQIDRFVAGGALLKDGRIVEADLIVTASGYLPPQELVRRLLGDQIADRIGRVWGVAGDGEMNNMYRPTAQKGLWFMGGGLAQCRIYARPLALQIKGHEEGLLP